MMVSLSSFPALVIVSALVLGLIVGSFLNVVIHRLPIMLERRWAEESEAIARERTCSDHDPERGPSEPHTKPAPRERFNLLVPRSTCPACNAPITALQNVPILSYLVLRGRCASCGARISVRYPIVEALTGVLSALVAWRLGFGWPALAALTLTWFLVALAFIDVDRQLLPDALTLPLLWMGLLLSLWGTHAGAPLRVDVRSSVIGAAAGYTSLWSVFQLFRLATGKEGMGYGDFKLFAALGAWLGWQMLLPIILIASGVGAVSGLVLITVKGRDRRTPIPFGPFLAASGWLTLMFGHEVVAAYLGFISPHP